MQTKLTLRLDSDLIRRAKAYARRTGKSLSSVIADYFASLHAGGSPDGERFSPKVRSLVGALRRRGGRPPTEADYRAHLEEKHR